MKIKEFNVILDIKKQSGNEPFEVVQGDSQSNLVNIFMVDGLDPYDLTGTNIEIIFSKSDGTTAQQTDVVVINELDGKIQCTLKTNTTASPGNVTAEVRILSDEILLTSARFEFYVRKSLINDETIESTNEFPVLTQLIVETNGLIEQVNQIEKQVPENVVQNIDDLELSKINKTDIIQTDTISDPTKVPSAAVTEALGKEIDTINNNLAGLKKMNVTIPANGTLKIMHDSNLFAYMLFVQGANGDAYGAYVLQGYGVGTSIRDHFIALQNGSAINVTLLDQTFTVASSSTSSCSCSVLVLFGNVPIIS